MRATEEAVNATTNPTMEEIDRILSLTTHQELEPSKKPSKQSYPWDTDEELNALLHQRKILRIGVEHIANSNILEERVGSWMDIMENKSEAEDNLSRGTNGLKANQNPEDLDHP